MLKTAILTLLLICALPGLLLAASTSPPQRDCTVSIPPYPANSGIPNYTCPGDCAYYAGFRPRCYQIGTGTLLLNSSCPSDTPNVPGRCPQGYYCMGVCEATGGGGGGSPISFIDNVGETDLDSSDWPNVQSCAHTSSDLASFASCIDALRAEPTQPTFDIIGCTSNLDCSPGLICGPDHRCIPSGPPSPPFP